MRNHLFTKILMARDGYTRAIYTMVEKTGLVRATHPLFMILSNRQPGKDFGILLMTNCTKKGLTPGGWMLASLIYIRISIQRNEKRCFSLPLVRRYVIITLFP